MVKTKGVERAVSNCKGSAGLIPQRYKEGIMATTDWQARAIAGDQLYKDKIAEAIAQDLRKKGIQKVTDADWKDASATKGASRIGPGISAAGEDFRKGIAGVIGVIEGVQLPERVADADTNIDNRVKPIARALQNAKREGRL